MQSGCQSPEIPLTTGNKFYLAGNVEFGAAPGFLHFPSLLFDRLMQR
jgi:hypothetical protein